MKKIKCAAIRYALKNSPADIKYTWGANHAQCIQWFACAEIYQRDRVPEVEQSGFLTTDGEFVDRKTAYEIAEAAGQLRCPREDRILYSEFCKYQ